MLGRQELAAPHQRIPSKHHERQNARGSDRGRRSDAGLQGPPINADKLLDFLTMKLTSFLNPVERISSRQQGTCRSVLASYHYPYWTCIRGAWPRGGLASPVSVLPGIQGQGRLPQGATLPSSGSKVKFVLHTSPAKSFWR